VIVEQHDPEVPALERVVWRLLGPRLRGAEPAVDPLEQLRQGMQRLAVRDADQRLVQVLSALVAAG
jgi:UDP-N-acetylglucosamine--N-acetylmuramyl-(pentapeptide) pyrophosphoryl-undecaprenol N-acetylglucosamine transferase